ncbi:MAG: spore coat protein CotJB [Clostridia bacterium]|nr:spore coat protein CotJB [Clostridia bacterium]
MEYTYRTIIDPVEHAELYHKLKEQHEELCREYEKVCGPLTAFGNESHTTWDWMSHPAPWEYGAE